MKKTSIIIAAAALALSIPLSLPAMEHDHGAMHAGHGGQMMQMGTVVHQEVAGGVKATFSIIDMRAQLKGSEVPKGMNETHHLMVRFADAKTGKTLTSGEVKVKVIGPDKSEQVKDLMGMEGHFGADFVMAKKGKYGIMCKFKLAGGKVESSKFWYEVK
jgi:hypothetical protein